jgi:hypothetical protein
MGRADVEAETCQGIKPVLVERHLDRPVHRAERVCDIREEDGVSLLDGQRLSTFRVPGTSFLSRFSVHAKNDDLSWRL